MRDPFIFWLGAVQLAISASLLATAIVVEARRALRRRRQQDDLS